ncbi:MAG: ribose 5-phosphate isomerase B [Alphaproteobacteria bacterium]|nr:ribose 5-phosphate isomerase B [Alphaproteobacteria bacterium]MBU0859988.1 ribose 5-phosphate isomerase B [Alphaproteobacteria bacterium]
MKPVAIACDHAGFAMKDALMKALGDKVQWLDLGTHNQESCNYVDFGFEVGKAISDGRAERGIVICGSGIGISIAANRYAKVRCALCTDVTMARFSRLHNDANVLALGARITGIAVAQECVEVFLNTAFEGGRHQTRIEKLDTGI